jgi:hypothetical protein
MKILASFSAVLGLILMAPVASPDSQPELRALLSGELKFSAAELASLNDGRVVVRGLGATSPGEIAALGAVLVHGRRATFIERYRDIVKFKSGPDVIQIGKFSSPPTIGDLEGLMLVKEDVDLRACRVGHCDIRLPAATIGRFQKEIDWKARDADARAAVLFKQVLVAHVSAYLSGDPSRIAAYEDEKRPVHPIEDFAGLLKNSPFIGKLVPGLAEHLQDFPAKRLRGTEDFLYWSKEKFGITPFVTVTHVTIVPSSPTTSVIASKDVYSSRYFDASLTVTIASDAVGATDSFYLVYVNRSRANALKGAFSGLRRSIVERRARDSIDRNLRAVKLRFERER